MVECRRKMDCCNGEVVGCKVACGCMFNALVGTNLIEHPR